MTARAAGSATSAVAAISAVVAAAAWICCCASPAGTSPPPPAASRPTWACRRSQASTGKPLPAPAGWAIHGGANWRAPVIAALAARQADLPASQAPHRRMPRRRSWAAPAASGATPMRPEHRCSGCSGWICCRADGSARCSCSAPGWMGAGTSPPAAIHFALTGRRPGRCTG